MRRLVFLLLRLTSIPFLLRVIAQRNRVTILCWHDPAPAVLELHIRWLQHHYNIVSLREFVDWRLGKTNTPMPKKALVLTFDDGHKDNYWLKQLFESLHAPVTIFLCSAIIGTNRHYWWTAPKCESGKLKRLPDHERRTRLAALGFDENKEYEERQALSIDEIDVLKPLIDFQAHTRLHPILPMCTWERAIEEIEGCKTELEQKFKFDVYAIAYPNGDYSKREINAARSAGYQCALTLDGGSNTAYTNMFRLRRIPMHDLADINELVVKASGLWELLVPIFGGKKYGYMKSTASRALQVHGNTS